MMNQEHPGRTAYSPRELADAWGVHLHTVHRLIAAGELRAFKLVRAWRIPASEIERYEAEHGLRSRWFEGGPAQAAS